MPTAAGAAPALYRCLVTHVRSHPRRYVLRHRTYLWLIDIDDPPRLPAVLRPLARFDPADHFAGTAPTLREGLAAFLAGRGIELRPGGRVLMLAHARVLGHVFNPLTLYWCTDPDGTLCGIVAEVHNTYGERHCYAIRPDGGGAGVAGVAKEFYVSPFFPVAGDYRMRLPVPGERLDLAVRYELDGIRQFTATVRGTRRPAGALGLLRAAARRPLSTLTVSAAIRCHGVRLWLRGVPVQHRTRHRAQEGMR
jgi:hypothetical protein